MRFPPCLVILLDIPQIAQLEQSLKEKSDSEGEFQQGRNGQSMRHVKLSLDLPHTCN